MNVTDFITILGNVSQSLIPVQGAITGIAYVVGIIFFIVALHKLRNIADARTQSSSQEKIFVPLAYILGGMALLFLPSAVKIAAGTAFGPSNIISYGNYNRYDIYSIIGVVIRTAGVIWFVRGSILLTQSSEPGARDGAKGLAFIITGIFAINFDNSVAAISGAIDYITRNTL